MSAFIPREATRALGDAALPNGGARARVRASANVVWLLSGVNALRALQRGPRRPWMQSESGPPPQSGSSEMVREAAWGGGSWRRAAARSGGENPSLSWEDAWSLRTAAW
eukprot:2538322-Prymnesium_polylepis.2